MDKAQIERAFGVALVGTPTGWYLAQEPGANLMDARCVGYSLDEVFETLSGEHVASDLDMDEDEARALEERERERRDAAYEAACEDRYDLAKAGD